MPLIERLAALSGLAGSVVILVGISLADTSGSGLGADPTDPSSLIAKALVQNRGQTRMGAQLLLLGAFLMLWFLSYLYSHLRNAEGTSRWPSALVLGGGFVIATFLLIESGFYYAGSELENYGSDTQVAKMIHLWGWNSASLVAPGFAAILFGSAVTGFRHGAIQRWLAWFSVVMLVILVVIAVVLGTPGLGAGVGSLWTVVASLTLAFSPGVSPRSATE
jgi:hypothetical protein